MRLVNSAHLGNVRLGPIQPTQARLAIGRDGRKRLVDLVRNGGGQLAQHRNARRVREVRLHARKHFARPHQLRRFDDADKAQAQIAGRARPGGREQHVDHAPVERDEFRFLLERRLPAIPGFHRASERFRTLAPEACTRPCEVAGVARAEHADRQLVDFFDDERVHELPQEVGMPIEIGPEVRHALCAQTLEQVRQLAGVELPKRDRHVSKQIPIALLALPQRFIGALSILDVGNDSVPSDNVAGFIARRCRPKQEPAILAVETPQARLAVDRRAGGHILVPDVDELIEVIGVNA